LKKNQQKGTKYLKMAANAGFLFAQLRYAELLWSGIDVQKIDIELLNISAVVQCTPPCKCSIK
jgi:hypothetical protein